MIIEGKQKHYQNKMRIKKLISSSNQNFNVKGLCYLTTCMLYLTKITNLLTGL